VEGLIVDKKRLTEQEVRSNYIRPAIINAGWTSAQIREDYAITLGRIIARGGVCKRDVRVATPNPQHPPQ
jgi:type I restriction enzyme R subunit